MTAHRFDTGQPKAQRTMVRNAVIAKLAPLLKSNGGYLRMVKALARPVKSEHEASDDYGFKLILNEAQGNMPCVLVALGRANYHEFNTEATELSADLEVCLYVCSSNMHDRVDGRLAAGALELTDVTLDPGIETMVEHVEERIVGQDLGVPLVYEPELKFTDNLATGDDQSWWELRFVVRCHRTTNPNRDITQLMLSIEADNELDGVPAAGTPLVTTITTLGAPP